MLAVPPLFRRCSAAVPALLFDNSARAPSIGKIILNSAFSPAEQQTKNNRGEQRKQPAQICAPETAPGRGVTGSRYVLIYQGVDCLSQVHIALRQPACVMRGEQDVDPVPHIRPFGVMVGLLRQQGDPRHEGEGGAEIGKGKAARDGIARLVIIPFVECIERLGTGFVIELRDFHAVLTVAVCSFEP